MRRRTVLAAGAGGMLGLAGCSGLLGDSDGEDGGSGGAGPDDVLESFWEALIDGDVEGANAYLHEDARIDSVTEADVSGSNDVEASIEDVTVIERGDGRAEVRISVRTVWVSGNEPTTAPLTYELRDADGEWRIYDDVTQEQAGSDGRSAPGTTWYLFERTNDAGRTHAVSFEHAGGDAVDAGMLSVVANEQTAGPPAESQQLMEGSFVEAAFQDGGDSLPSGTVVSLVWTDPDSGDRQVIARIDLESETTGPLAARFEIASGA